MTISENKNYQNLILTAITFGALFLRVSKIDSPLAGDEAISFNRYSHLSTLELLLNYPDSNQHAFFSILSNFCLLIFGDYEFAFRFPSFFVGVLVIPLVYYTGRSLGLSQIISLSSAFLMAIYTPHIFYSQEGRGYALTVFLSTSLVLSSIKILENRCLWFWGSVLIISSTCMVISLPSNTVFVVGAAGFCCAFIIIHSSDSIAGQKYSSKNCMLCYVIAFLLIICYLGTNFSDIKFSAQVNSIGEVTWEHFLGIAEFLVSPWGLWLYVFLLIGFLSNLEKSIRYSMLALFSLPIGLSLITGVVGFARIYIYFSPFLLMLVSVGFFFLYEKILSVNKNFGYAILVLSFLGILYQPFLSLLNEKNSSFGNGYMQDAIKLHTFTKKLPLNVLPVITNAAIGRSILIHYLGDEIAQRMRLFVAGKKIEKILFFSKTGVPPSQHSLGQVFEDVRISLPIEKNKLVESFGSFEVFEWDIKLSRLAPGESYLDYESQVAGLNQSIKTYTIDNTKAVGQTSLLIINPVLPAVSPNISIVFPTVYQINFEDQEGFILNLFIKASRHETLFRPTLVSKKPVKIPSAYLNPSLNRNDSDFENRGEGGRWEMVVLLSKIGRGPKLVREIIDTHEVKTLIDGVQSYVIK
jgi:hypothetical protein